MKRAILVVLLIFALINVTHSVLAQQHYVSPDGKLIAAVVRIGTKKTESRIEIRKPGGKLLAHAGYGSRDGEHGLGVIKAAWTPDSRFFVWSMESSGGHSPWHHWTYFYSRRLKRVLFLDDFVGAITTDFTLQAPDIVHTRRLQSGNIEGVPVTVRLSRLRPGKQHKTIPFSTGQALQR